MNINPSTQQPTMPVMLTLITNSWLFKICFGYSLGFSTLSMIEQTFGNTDFFSRILNAIPSKIIMYLGVAYGIALVLKQISNAWKTHQVNRYEVKERREQAEQKEIETDIKRKELDQ